MELYEYPKIAVYNKRLVENVKRADSYFTRWVRQQPYKTPLIAMYTDPKKDRGFAKTLKVWEEGVVWHGIKYVYWCSGAGDSRKKQWYMIREELRDEAFEKFMCGLTMEDINRKFKGKHVMSALRFTNYLSMVLSSGFPIDVNLRRICCLPDKQNEIYYVADWIDAENKVVKPKQTIEEELETVDGGGVFKVGLFGERHAFTYRLPWNKGCLSEFDWNLVPEKMTDVWDNEVDKNDVDIILTASQFKAWKCYQSWEHFVECCEATGAEFEVCVEAEDSSWFAAAYQPLQTLKLTDEEVGRLMVGDFTSIERMLKDPGALAKAIGLPVPNGDVLNSRLYLAKIREYLEAKLNQLVCGKIRMAGGFYFLVPDWRQYFWGEGLKPGECACQGPGDWQQNDVIWCVRYPHMGTREHCLMVNKHTDWAPQGCIIINAQDNACLRMNADWDSSLSHHNSVNS